MESNGGGFREATVPTIAQGGMIIAQCDRDAEKGAPFMVGKLKEACSPGGTHPTIAHITPRQMPTADRHSNALRPVLLCLADNEDQGMNDVLYVDWYVSTGRSSKKWAGPYRRGTGDSKPHTTHDVNVTTQHSSCRMPCMWSNLMQERQTWVKF